jgi:ribonuclease-3
MISGEEIPSTTDVLAECEAVLGYNFQDRTLLFHCLTHASGAKTRLASNERLEFLGDSVLGLIVCEMLFKRFPEATEGELTRIKSILVSRTTCAKISLQLGCDRLIFVGKGLKVSERVPESVVAAVFESLIAGVYLDGGLEPARQLIERVMDPEIDLTTQQDHGRNFKSLLQQYSQKNLGATPIYKLLDQRGPDHSKWFKVAATIGQHAYAPAWGANKKEAEQRAAHNALFELEGKIIPTHPDNQSQVEVPSLEREVTLPL